MERKRHIKNSVSPSVSPSWSIFELYILKFHCLIDAVYSRGGAAWLIGALYSSWLYLSWMAEYWCMFRKLARRRQYNPMPTIRRTIKSCRYLTQQTWISRWGYISEMNHMNIMGRGNTVMKSRCTPVNTNPTIRIDPAMSQPAVSWSDMWGPTHRWYGSNISPNRCLVDLHIHAMLIGSNMCLWFHTRGTYTTKYIALHM